MAKIKSLDDLIRVSKVKHDQISSEEFWKITGELRVVLNASITTLLFREKPDNEETVLNEVERQLRLEIKRCVFATVADDLLKLRSEFADSDVDINRDEAASRVDKIISRMLNS